MKDELLKIADVFEALEARITELEQRVAALEQWKLTPSQPEPIEETPVEEPIVEPEPVVEPEPIIEPEPVVEPEPVQKPIQTNLFGPAVEDIRHAISLGDRFLFQRELFAGNGELMQKTLDSINNLHSFEEAEEYIQRFNWEHDSQAYNQFVNILHRRF